MSSSQCGLRFVDGGGVAACAVSCIGGDSVARRPSIHHSRNNNNKDKHVRTRLQESKNNNKDKDEVEYTTLHNDNSHTRSGRLSEEVSDASLCFVLLDTGLLCFFDDGPFPTFGANLLGQRNIN